MARKRFDPDERVGLDMDPEDALEAILGGAGVDPDDVEMDPEESETES
jgi:hypothetical protein